MIKVQNKVDIYKVNGEVQSDLNKPHLLVESDDTEFSNLVSLTVGTVTIEVNSRDLIKAINNSSNK